ncbi:MAG: hypothetical protein KME31_01280 [Tolypothrix carrinoi HA7290-LM1]|nr:hypothetical protein [Tolypothrix carrinoi HA7290-LM1]
MGGSADSHAPGVETTAGAVACGTRPPHCLPLAERLSLWEKTALAHHSPLPITHSPLPITHYPFPIPQLLSISTYSLTDASCGSS